MEPLVNATATRAEKLVRKIKPNDVTADFVKAIEDVETTLSEVRESDLTDSTKLLVAESSLLTSVVLWEGFITDLFVAHINNDSGQLVAKVEGCIKKQFGQCAATAFRSAMPPNLPVKDARNLLDPKDYNLSFESASQMVSRAQADLSASAAAKFEALTPSDCAAIDAWHHLRNFVAHRSRSSRNRMNKHLKAKHVPAPLGRKENDVKNVGSFLTKHAPGTQKWRVQHYVASMKSIGQRL